MWLVARFEVKPAQPCGSNFPTAPTTPVVTVPPVVAVGVDVPHAARIAEMEPRLRPRAIPDDTNSRRLIRPAWSRPTRSSMDTDPTDLAMRSPPVMQITD